jgi:hypothetical protein
VDRPAPADRREQVAPRAQVAHQAPVEPLDPVAFPGAAAVPARVARVARDRARVRRVAHRVRGLRDQVALVAAMDRVRDRLARVVLARVQVLVQAQVRLDHRAPRALRVPRVHRMVLAVAKGVPVLVARARPVSVLSCGSRCTSKASGAACAPNRVARFWSGS